MKNNGGSEAMGRSKKRKNTGSKARKKQWIKETKETMGESETIRGPKARKKQWKIK